MKIVILAEKHYDKHVSKRVLHLYKYNIEKYKEFKEKCATKIESAYRGHYTRLQIYIPHYIAYKNKTSGVSLIYNMDAIKNYTRQEIKSFCYICPFQNENGRAYARIEIIKRNSLTNEYYECGIKSGTECEFITICFAKKVKNHYFLSLCREDLDDLVITRV